MMYFSLVMTHGHDDAAKVVDGLAPQVADKKASMEQVKKIYKLFCDCDCTMLEINPLAKTSDNHLVAADAKLNFDDNAYFRKNDIFALRDPSQEDPREVAAAKADLNHIGLQTTEQQVHLQDALNDMH